MTRNKKEYKNSLGLVLCTCGISIGGLVKVIIGRNISIISIVISAFSVLLLFNFSSFKELRRVPSHVLSIFCYTIYTLILALFSDTGIWDNTVGIGYQIVYFVQILLLWGLNNTFDEDSFLRINFWVTGIATILSLIVVIKYASIDSLGILLTKTESASMVSRATTALIAFCGFAGSIVYEAKTPANRICRILFIIISVAVMLISTRRNVLLAVIVSVIVYFQNKGIERKVNRSHLLRGLEIAIVLLVVFMIVYQTNDAVHGIIDRGVQSLIRGVRSYLGLDYDMAVSYRRNRIETIPSEYINNSTAFQFLFGRGYNTDELDIPFLQAFWDMGLLGGIWFFVIQGITPIKHVFRKTKNPAVLWAKFGVILTVIQGFSNGTPYGKFLYIVTMYMLEVAVLKREDSIAEKSGY